MEERVVSCFDRIGILVDEDDVKMILKYKSIQWILWDLFP